MRVFKVIVRLLSLLGLVLGGLLIFWSASSSNVLSLRDYDYRSSKLPQGFSYKIVQLSDWHNHALAYDNVSLMAAVAKAKPDLIVCTGDMIDNHSKEEDFSKLETLFASFQGTPVYYVNGNHEKSAPLSLTARLEDLYRSHGVFCLNRQRHDLGNGIVLSGLDDPGSPSTPSFSWGEYLGDVPDQLKSLGAADEAKVNLLLAHRPRYADEAKAYGYDVQLSGHTHGGQIVNGNQPLVNAPQNPYVAGYYGVGSLSLYVSRGLGVSYELPFRYHCDAELVSLTIVGTAGEG